MCSHSINTSDNEEKKWVPPRAADRFFLVSVAVWGARVAVILTDGKAVSVRKASFCPLSG